MSLKYPASLQQTFGAKTNLHIHSIGSFKMLVGEAGKSLWRKVAEGRSDRVEEPEQSLHRVYFLDHFCELICDPYDD